MITSPEATATTAPRKDLADEISTYALPAGTKILVVDDVVDIQIVLKFFLEYRGAIVLTAGGGTEAVELALQEKPDLILMDMKLPDGMSGYVATRSLRSHGFGEPIIAMTGLASNADREMCFRAGCSDYLRKPLDLDQLLVTLARHL